MAMATKGQKQNENSSISDSEILALWKDPNFNGSFRGARSFQIFLKTDKNIDIALQRIYKVLNTDSIYISHQRPIRNFPRRHYDVRTYGEVCAMDLAFMFPFEEFIGFLLLIDLYSSKIFTEPVKSKNFKSISDAFLKIVQRFGTQIHVLETDQGKYLLSKKILCIITLLKWSNNFLQVLNSKF